MAKDLVALAGSRGLDALDAQLPRGTENFVGDRVGYARMIGDLDDIAAGFTGRGDGLDDKALCYWVGKKKTPEELTLPGRYIPANKINFRARHGPDLIQAKPMRTAHNCRRGSPSRLQFPYREPLNWKLVTHINGYHQARILVKYGGSFLDGIGESSCPGRRVAKIAAYVHQFR